ncbi:MAG TPA: methyltransferase domain-containing protein [Candidatus Acidoferrales bacterium]|jgi:ubiquinone/menaquinone biosynthesis C-methylase UbiE|nr:methyltransferase domain-containing protein [Candidatus Acidoferrales bacterium]
MTRSASDTPEQTTVHKRVQSQFGAAAAAYGTSRVHTDGSALQRVVELARPRPDDVALDIATGAGHTALALAPRLASVIAYDLTPEMLLETRRSADARGLTNIETKQGPAEKLPFPDSSFDIVTVRQAPHHFADVRSAIREMTRVARRGARVVIVDSTSPEDPVLAAQWDHWERLRDPSHVQNYSPSQWRAMVADAGLQVFCEEIGYATENGRPMDFAAWTKRINTPTEAVEELTRLFRNASPALAEALRIEVVNGAISFCVPVITIGALQESK